MNTHGTDAFTEPARADSEMVRRLREAGAIIVGLTLLPELAICGFTESATYGVTRNPWNPQRSPGGSSGGSAAAVAAGLVPIASAGDGGGSIRIPAASCGLFGLKPQRGRISFAPDLEILERARGQRLRQPHRARHGALARRDLRRLEGAGSAAAARAALRRVGADRARASCASPGRPRRRAPRRRRWSPTSSRRRSPTAAELLKSLGHEVSHQDPDWGNDRQQHHAPLPARRLRRRWPRSRIRSGSNGAPAASAGSAACCPTRSSSGRCKVARPTPPRINAIFDSHDVLITPVMGGTAIAGPPLGGPRRPAHGARDEPLLPLLHPLEPPRQPGDVGPVRFRRRRHAARGPDHRPPRRRGDPALARRPDRGRAALGRPPAAD